MQKNVKGSRNYRSRPHEEYVKDGRWWYQNTAYVGPKKGLGAAAGAATSNKGLSKAPSLKKCKGRDISATSDPAVTYALGKLGKKYGLKDGELDDVVGSVMAGAVPAGAPVGPAMGRVDAVPTAPRQPRPKQASTLALSLGPDGYRERTEQEAQTFHVYDEILSRSPNREARKQARTEFRSELLKDTVGALREGYERDGRKFSYSVEDEAPVWVEAASSPYEADKREAEFLHVGMDGNIIKTMLYTYKGEKSRPAVATESGFEFPTPDGKMGGTHYSDSPFCPENFEFVEDAPLDKDGVEETLFYENGAVISSNHYLALSKDSDWADEIKKGVGDDGHGDLVRYFPERLNVAKKVRRETFGCPPDHSYEGWLNQRTEKMTGTPNLVTRVLRNGEDDLRVEARVPRGYEYVGGSIRKKSKYRKGLGKAESVVWRGEGEPPKMRAATVRRRGKKKG